MKVDISVDIDVFVRAHAEKVVDDNGAESRARVQASMLDKVRGTVGRR